MGNPSILSSEESLLRLLLIHFQVYLFERQSRATEWKWEGGKMWWGEREKRGGERVYANTWACESHFPPPSRVVGAAGCSQGPGTSQGSHWMARKGRSTGVYEGVSLHEVGSERVARTQDKHPCREYKSPSDYVTCTTVLTLTTSVFTVLLILLLKIYCFT